MSARTLVKRAPQPTKSSPSIGKYALQAVAGFVVLAGGCYLISIPIISRLNQMEASTESTDDKGLSSIQIKKTIRYGDKPISEKAKGKPITLSARQGSLNRSVLTPNQTPQGAYTTRLGTLSYGSTITPSSTTARNGRTTPYDTLNYGSVITPNTTTTPSGYTDPFSTLNYGSAIAPNTTTTPGGYGIPSGTLNYGSAIAPNTTTTPGGYGIPAVTIPNPNGY